MSTEMFGGRPLVDEGAEQQEEEARQAVKVSVARLASRFYSTLSGANRLTRIAVAIFVSRSNWLVSWALSSLFVCPRGVVRGVLALKVSGDL